MADGTKDTAATSTATSGQVWIIYACLLLLRFACVLLPGYTHPDEFYQGGQELFFGIPPSPEFAALYPDGFGGTWSWTTSSTDGEQAAHSHLIVPTWEFEPQNAIRSIVPPLFMTVLPLKIYAALRRSLLVFGAAPASSVWMEDLSGFEIWILPRLFLALLSLVMIDLPCYVLMKRSKGDRQGDKENSRIMELIAIALAPSWPALTFLCRPFSNTLEAMMLSVLLLVVSSGLCADGNNEAALRTISRSILVGFVCSIGLFVRFTFAFFASPPVTMYLFKKGKIGRILGHGIIVACGFLTTSIAFVAVDTMFYSQLSSAGRPDGSIGERAVIGGHYITPLNALLYNSNVDNLGEHGIHPRITHLLVNLPMLFGPLAVFFYADVMSIFGGWSRRRGSKRRQQQKYRSIIPPDSARTMYRLTIMGGVFVLSCAPHQEPRFLLPAIVPLVVLYGTNLTQVRWAEYIWPLFNVVLFIFFGFLHQSGVVPSLLASNDIAGMNGGNVGPAMFIYHHTYMPPSFLTRRPKRDSTQASNLMEQCDGDECVCSTSPDTMAPVYGHHIIDLKDTRWNVLHYSINVALECGLEDKGQEMVYVVSPASVGILAQVIGLNDATPWAKLEVNLAKYYFPHITTEDMPRWNRGFGSFLSQFQMRTNVMRCA